MLYVGIDVANDKHDCFAMNSDGEILIEKLTITNNLDDFETLYNSLMQFSIATMLISDNLKPYIPVSYHISELKSLTRHRFRLVKENSKFKTSLVRLVDIVFPEFPKIVSSVAQKSSLALLYELPSAKEIAECNLKHLTHLLYDNSNKKFDRDKAIEIRELAKKQ